MGNYGAHELNRAETWKEPTQLRNGSPMTQHLCFWPHPGNLDICSPELTNHVYSNALKITQGESDSHQLWRGRWEHCFVLRPCSGSGSTRCARNAKNRKTQTCLQGAHRQEGGEESIGELACEQTWHTVTLVPINVYLTVVPQGRDLLATSHWRKRI